MTSTTSTSEDRWHRRPVPAALAEQYRAEGWWDDATFGTMVADGLGDMRHIAFRVRSKLRPWTGTFADVDRAARSLAGALGPAASGPVTSWSCSSPTGWRPASRSGPPPTSAP